MLVYPLLIKKQFWIFRHLHLYAGFRKLGLPLLLIAVFVTWYGTAVNPEPVIPADESDRRQKVFYTGIYSPGTTEGITSLQDVQDYQRRYNTRFSIISLYIPWGNAPQSCLQDTLMQSIYNNGSLPMITWEPWDTAKVFAGISAGLFDDYLRRFAGQIKALQRPVYLRFAHEADNPAYPWSQSGGNTAEEFRNAWKYIHQFFAREGANNAIWVWNPWRATAAEDYFPGKEYVDWIGVTGLNYGPQNENGQSYSFRELYMPFHRLPVFRSGLPVMIAEMGSLAAAGNQEQWMEDAFSSIDRYFPEIHALVFFNSNRDRNILRPVAGNVLDWQLRQPGQVLAAKEKYFRDDAAQWLANAAPPEERLRLPAGKRFQLPDTIRGLNYHKGENWFRNLHALTRREVEKDFAGMKALGVNTIRRFGPGMYDRNILRVAKETDMRVHYGFWIPTLTDMQKDRKMLVRLGKTILQRVRELKHDRSIVAWNIGNTNWQQFENYYYKPQLFYQQEAYLDWLRTLITAIKAIDPTRPLTVDAALSDNITGTLEILQQALPQADAFGIVAGEDTTGLSKLKEINIPHFISQIPVEYYNRQPAFITTWQDLETRDYVTFDGLTDHWGRYKPSYYRLASIWNKSGQQPALPEIHILRPARATYPGSRLTYHALVLHNQEWTLAGDSLQFEWHLVKTDSNGNPIFLKKLGEGASIDIDIPENPQYYGLYLQALRGDQVTTARSPLNTPLWLKMQP